MQDSKPPQFPRGAMAPGALSWQIGKTANSIKFVNDVTEAITKLQDAINKVKSGEVVLEENLTVIEYLSRDDRTETP